MISLSQVSAVMDLADRRGRDVDFDVSLAAAAMIDHLNGEDMGAEVEADFWGAIEANPSTPDYHYAMRAAEAYVPAMRRAA